MLARVPYPYSLADAQQWLGSVPQRSKAGLSVNWALDVDGLIGVITLGEIREIEGGKVAELGYWLAKPYWGKGYMTEAGREMVRYAFETLGFAGLKSGHFKENYRSGRVMAKLGFRYAGEGTKHCLARNAEIAHVDVVMTRAQWLEHASKRAA